MGAARWFRNVGCAAEVAELYGTSGSECILAMTPNPGVGIAVPCAAAAGGGCRFSKSGRGGSLADSERVGQGFVGRHQCSCGGVASVYEPRR